MDLNKTTLSEQIYQILRADIVTQKIRLGEKLTLKSLQERFSVSSTPIREALTRLAEDDLVVSYSNVGVNVIEIGERDLRELYQFMGDLDGLAILYASRYPNQAEVIDALEQNIRKTASIYQDREMTPPEIEEWTSSSDQFHLIFYDFCQNQRLTRAAQKQRSQLTIFSNMYEASREFQISIEKGHEAILETYRNGQYQETAEKMREHLGQSLEYALKCLEKLHDGKDR